MFERLSRMMSRAIVTMKDGSNALRKLQTLHLGNEVRNNVEHFEPYGFTSEPHLNAEVLTVSLDGDREHTIAAIVTDRRYRPVGLKDGEVCVYDSLGRKVYLSREGIVVEGVDSPITVKTSASVEVQAPTVHMTGNLIVDGNITAKGQINDLSGNGGSSMSGMRGVYNSHTHVHGDSSSQSPTQKM